MKRIIAIFLAALSVLSLSACLGTNKTAATEINLYFKDGGSGELTIEKVKYTNSQNTVDMANFAMKKLYEGPSKSSNVRTLPDKVTFSGVSVKNEIATIDFSEEFASLTGNDELLTRFSVVRTLCDIPGITGVYITVNGEGLVSNSTGKEIGVINIKDIVIDIGAAVEPTQKTTTITLYFSTTDALALKGEVRKVTTQETLSIEKTIINELLKGPTSPELVNVIPSGTKLLNIATKDGVCYVNLSSDFISKFPGGTGKLCVYSIVNSLCSLESVSAVQILIEGEKGQEFGDYVFDEPITSDLSIVQKK